VGIRPAATGRGIRRKGKKVDKRQGIVDHRRHRDKGLRGVRFEAEPHREIQWGGVHRGREGSMGEVQQNRECVQTAPGLQTLPREAKRNRQWYKGRWGKPQYGGESGGMRGKTAVSHKVSVPLPRKKASWGETGGEWFLKMGAALPKLLPTREKAEQAVMNLISVFGRRTATRGGETRGTKKLKKEKKKGEKKRWGGKSRVQKWAPTLVRPWEREKQVGGENTS